MDMNDAAKHVLCRAFLNRRDPTLYQIKRTLGYKTWASCGELGRPDIAPLYKAGYVREWFSPWSPLLYLTEAGVEARKRFRKELGYD